MSKRNIITYVKPQDPSFLAKLKEQIGYKEGPTIETKKQKLEDLVNDNDSDVADRPEFDDEKPQVVVLRKGDLTAEQAAAEEKRLAKEAAEARADLNQRVIFQKKQQTQAEQVVVAATSKRISNKKEKKLSKIHKRPKLSFDPDNDDDE